MQAGLLTIVERTSANVTIFELSGDIRLGDESGLLRDQVRGKLKERRPTLLSFKNVTCLDSTGVGVLVELHAHAIGIGMNVRLCEIPEFGVKLLQQLSLTNILEIYASEQEALAGWTG
jgi:anti-anti-sigma factor